MIKLVIGIFAHPDDETFGPGGTLAKWSREGTDVHTLTLTRGEAGVNGVAAQDLGATRYEELQQAAHILGVRSTCFTFPDSELSQKLYPVMGSKIEEAINRILESYESIESLRIVTFEDHGITGHLDHIVASFLATRAYCILRENYGNIELWQYCLSESQQPDNGWTDYFTPRGRSDRYITDSVNVREYIDTKLSAMDAHKSQIADANTLKELGRDYLATEHFHVTRNSTVGQES